MNVTEITKDSLSKSCSLVMNELDKWNKDSLVPSFWQSTYWGHMVMLSDQVEKILVVKRDDDFLLFEKRKVALWEFWLFCIWTRINRLKDWENDLKQLAKYEKALFIQIENFSITGDIQFRSTFSKWFYKKFIEPVTNVIDLTESEEDILAKMKPKWRYNIKVAKKHNVVCKCVEKNEKNVTKFFDLMAETTSRDNFHWNSLEYYETFLKQIEWSDLIFAYKDEKIIAAWIFVYFYDKALYYYWASSSDREVRKFMAPYLLQWTAILEWINRKCKYYDFLWIAPEGQPNHHLSGVTDFKLKFSTDTKKVSDSVIYKHKKIKYLFIAFLRFVKEKIGK